MKYIYNEKEHTINGDKIDSMMPPEIEGDNFGNTTISIPATIILRNGNRIEINEHDIIEKYKH